MMKIFAGCVALTVACIALTACNSRYLVAGKCNSKKECEVEGRIEGQFPKQSLASALLDSAQVADASLFQIDTTGSTIRYPSHGTVSIWLVHSATGAIRAQRAFDWHRTGPVIRLTDPDAVNAWAAAQGADADAMAYRLTRFQSDYGAGEQAITVKAVYAGEVRASSSSTFTSCAPLGVLTPYPCRL